MTDKRIIMEYEQRYLYATYLYYHGPLGVESPICDEEYDRIQAVLEAWWSKTSKLFRSRTERPLKTSAHTMELSSEEKREAIEWAQREEQN